MAFNTAAVRTVSSSPRGTDESWKAQGFINLYLPTKNGTRRKLGAIPLKANKPSDKALLEWLNEDPSRVDQIMSKLVMEYQSAEGTDETAFDL